MIIAGAIIFIVATGIGVKLGAILVRGSRGRTDPTRMIGPTPMKRDQDDAG